MNLSIIFWARLIFRKERTAAPNGEVGTVVLSSAGVAVGASGACQPELLKRDRFTGDHRVVGGMVVVGGNHHSLWPDPWAARLDDIVRMDPGPLDSASGPGPVQVSDRSLRPTQVLALSEGNDIPLGFFIAWQSDSPLSATPLVTFTRDSNGHLTIKLLETQIRNGVF